MAVQPRRPRRPRRSGHCAGINREQIVRAAGIPWAVLNPGLTYGRGDHYLDHLAHAVATVPVYVGIGARRIRPLWVEDLVDVLTAAVVARALDDRTVPVLGPTDVGFDDAVRQIAGVLDRRVLVTRLPMAFHRLLAVASEAVMTVPLVARSQVRTLAEEIVEPVLAGPAAGPPAPGDAVLGPDHPGRATAPRQVRPQGPPADNQPTDPGPLNQPPSVRGRRRPTPFVNDTHLATLVQTGTPTPSPSSGPRPSKRSATPSCDI